MKLLVIEDEKKVANFILQGLREEHYEVECAYDGEQGLEKALTGEFDGIVLDLMMPKRDGISLLREFRARGMTTPVLILTAKGTIQDKITGLDSGADDYLAKPFHFEELTARIRSMLRRSSVEKSTQLKVGDLVNTSPGEGDWQQVLAVMREPSDEAPTSELRSLVRTLGGRYVVVQLTDLAPVDGGIYFSGETAMVAGADESEDQPVSEAVSDTDGDRVYLYTKFELVTVRSR